MTSPSIAPRRSSRTKQPSSIGLAEPNSNRKKQSKAQNGPPSKSTKKQIKGVTKSKTKPSKAIANGIAKIEEPPRIGDEERSYWLMKAEPESRIEKGVDVKFSIDDLAAATEPEGWDGVRNFVARNNMRAMKKGDFAFFYHSNTKVPGVAGTMEIVAEHSPDKSAQDVDHPYYDPKENPEDPKWSLVKVEFRRKFPKLVSLKELQKYKGPGQELEDLQVLKVSRLSVSRVSKDQWIFINELADALSQQQDE